MSDAQKPDKPENSEQEGAANNAVLASTAQAIQLTIIQVTGRLMQKVAPKFAMTTLRGVAAGLALALGELEGAIEAGYAGQETSDGKSIADHLLEDRARALALGREQGAARRAKAAEMVEKFRAAVASGDLSALRAAGVKVLDGHGAEIEEAPTEELPTNLFGAKKERFES